MTIRSSYETALSDLGALATECQAAADAITTPNQDDGSSTKKATLQRAADNAREAVARLRGPGTTKAGPTDSVRERLSTFSL